jgi:hypothetical protein
LEGWKDGPHFNVRLWIEKLILCCRSKFFVI